MKGWARGTFKLSDADMKQYLYKKIKNVNFRGEIGTKLEWKSLFGQIKKKMEFVWQTSVLFSVCRKLPKCLAPSWTSEKSGGEQNRRTGEQVIVNSGRDSQKNRHASHGVKHLLINCGVFWSVLAHEMLHQGCQIKITNNWLKTSSWNPRSRFMNHKGSDDWYVILQLDLKVIWWDLMVETLYQCILDIRSESLFSHRWWKTLKTSYSRNIMTSKSGQKRPPKFIYELPYTVTRELVELLNINDAWETLAGEHLQLRQTEISESGLLLEFHKICLMWHLSSGLMLRVW